MIFMPQNAGVYTRAILLSILVTQEQGRENTVILYILLTNTNKPNSSWESVTHDFSPVFGACQNKQKFATDGDNIQSKKRQFIHLKRLIDQPKINGRTPQIQIIGIRTIVCGQFIAARQELCLPYIEKNVETVLRNRRPPSTHAQVPTPSFSGPRHAWWHSSKYH